MDLRSDHTFSLTQYGEQPTYPCLNQDLACDVLVLGGGISGALAAHHLVKLGLNCVIADKRDVGMGSTSASTSMLLYELDDPIVKLKKQIGVQTADKVFKACAEAVAGLVEVAREIDFRKMQKRKSLYFTGCPADYEMMKDEYQLRKQLGFEVSFLSSDELQQEYGLKADAAILSECGAQTDAYLFTHALHSFNKEKMCGIFSKTKVVNLDFQRNKIVALLENNNTITANHIVHATGYESQEYLPGGLAELHSTYVTCGKKPAKAQDFGEKAMFWNSADPYLYIRAADDMIMVGGEDEMFYDAELRDSMIKLKEKILKEKFHEVFPSVSFTESYSWCGTFGTTKDGMPYIGSYGDPRNHFLLGFGGNGIVFSHIAAEILSYRILGKSHPLSDHFSFER